MHTSVVMQVSKLWVATQEEALLVAKHRNEAEAYQHNVFIEKEQVAVVMQVSKRWIAKQQSKPKSTSVVCITCLSTCSFGAEPGPRTPGEGGDVSPATCASGPEELSPSARSFSTAARTASSSDSSDWRTSAAGPLTMSPILT